MYHICDFFAIAIVVESDIILLPRISEGLVDMLESVDLKTSLHRKLYLMKLYYENSEM